MLRDTIIASVTAFVVTFTCVALWANAQQRVDLICQEGCTPWNE